ncbi:hypothetical protein SAMN05216257_102272 [Meinhardsimonia xiamenensis]|jgi:uncharacterized protein YdcH (DUF465 family)|uniref:DUF465 domain-containing protein n=1 Tax=Meinhardsimonia xiamenensis TaxID=990712 RepID=A0A1G9ATG9_9RHOB|nr:DUF465 domain-containing protein [Meinhardsimonia xiamenensis]PRX35252.1 hypothetical protein LV81_01847 [Meinhardsimonia xiamenensis]SDK30602.1 hypothetical protein SAMN05216257_102272 [Meinhardsimonia xiamenensis]
MSHRPHLLEDEFPEHAALIAELKQSDTHFAHLAERFEALNREIHALEVSPDPELEPKAEELRRKRVALKDEIYAYLKKKAAGAAAG